MFLAAAVAISFTACGGGDAAGDGSGTETVDAPKYNSEYFDDVMFAEGGEFVGLNLGDSRSDVKAKLPESAFDDETDSYLYYYWDLNGNQYWLDLYFDEAGKLNSIDGYVYFYDAESNYDEAAAKAFYTDMRDAFTAKYGAEEEEVDEDFVYTYWYFDNKDVEVGLDGGEVYWYMYSYEESEI